MHSIYVRILYFSVSSSVAEIQLVATPEDATNSTYSITVNCTINPASTADMCEVMASANDQTLTGNECMFLLQITFGVGWYTGEMMFRQCIST